MKNVLLTVLACALFAGCSTTKSSADYKLFAPDSAAPRETVQVLVSGSFAPGAKILWSTTAGHIEGPNNGLSAAFVAPESGAATLLCTIIAPGAATVALDKTIQIGASAASGASAAPVVAGSAAPNAGPAPPAGGPVQDIDSAGFIPSGWMGDITGLKVDPNSLDRPHSPPRCQKWSYKPSPSGGAGWAAVAWQFPENNWGEKPGRDWIARGFRQVSVWARGVRDRSGVLPKLQFKAGGGTAAGKPNQASFEVQGDFVSLTEDWKEYTLDLTGQNLKQVIAALVVVIRAQDVGPNGATFYLDDIEYR